MGKRRSYLAPPEDGCPSEPLWQGYWERLRLPLTDAALEQANRIIATYADPDDPQGSDGDCPHCVEQVERLIRLTEQAEQAEQA